MKYHISSRIFHWAMAIIIISAICLGVYMTEFLPKDASNRSELYGLHKSLGILVLLLIFPRIINRFINKPPALPETIKKIDQILAHAGHIVLYILMILVPLSGYLMSNSYGYRVKLFSIEMPFIIEKNYELGKIFSSLHYYLGYGILFMVLIHIAAVVKHRFFDSKENDVLKRMI